MAFWDDVQIEPKRKFKFFVTIAGGGASHDKVITIPPYVIKKASKPSFSITEAKHSFLGHNFFFPGKLEWKEVDITLVDAAGFNESDSTATAGTDLASGGEQTDQTLSIMRLLHEFGYQHPTDTAAAVTAGTYANNAKTFSKWAGTTSLGSVTFKSIDSNGQVIEEWTLKNAWIKEVNFGDGDYSSDDIVELTLKIRYDWAEFSKTEDGTAETYPQQAGS